MSRDYHHPSVIYAKPNKSRSHQQEPERRDYDRRDPRAIPPEYYAGRSGAQQDHYNRHYRHPGDENRYDGKPAANHDHHNRHYQYKEEPESRGQHVRSKDRQYQYLPAQVDNAPLFVHTPHPNRNPNRRMRGDSRNHPLEQLFKPPPGSSHKHQDRADVHAAEVHATEEEVQNDPPVPPPPPPPPELEEVHDIRKPRKIREYRIRKNPPPNPEGSEDSASSSDDDDLPANEKAHGKDKHDKKKKSRKLWPHKFRHKHDKHHHDDDKHHHHKEPKPPPRPDNWYQQTHPEKVIKIGDITYIRARAYDKKWVERLMSAFEAFGFVIIGVFYKGGDAILKIIAPIAIIKSYTEILGPALQGLVLGITQSAK